VTAETRLSTSRALGAALLVCIACSTLYFAVGAQTNESGSFATEAWLQTVGGKLVPVRDYPYTGARPFLGYLYLPFFAVFGRSMAAWWWGSITLTTLASMIFGGLVLRRWAQPALIVFLLVGAASPMSQYSLLPSYLPPVWFAFAAALLPLYAARAGPWVVISVILLAWCGTAVHDAALGVAVGASLWGLLEARGWRARAAVVLATALGTAWYFVTPVWLYGLSWHEALGTNRFVQMWNRLSGFYAGGAPTVYVNSGNRLTPLRFGFWSVLGTLQEAVLPLAILALAGGFAVAWHTGLRRAAGSLWRDPLARLLVIVPVVAGLGYSVLSTWSFPLLLRLDTLPLAALGGGLAAICAAALSAEARRTLWIAVGIVWCLSLITERQLVVPGRKLGIAPVAEVARVVDAVTQSSDTIFSGYSAIGLQSRRALLPSLFRGAQSQPIYGGSTTAAQLRFYEEIAHHTLGAVVMVTEHWMETRMFLALQPDTTLELAFDGFRRRFRPVCGSEHPSYGTLMIWVPAGRETAALATLRQNGAGRRCALRS
jgi:hypothetical protein